MRRAIRTLAIVAIAGLLGCGLGLLANHWWGPVGHALVTLGLIAGGYGFLRWSRPSTLPSTAPAYIHAKELDDTRLCPGRRGLATTFHSIVDCPDCLKAIAARSEKQP